MLLLSSTGGFSLSFHGHAWWQKTGRWFSPFLTYPVQRTVKIPYFFSVLSFPKPAGKPITLKRAQRKKSMPWAVSLAQTHRALTRLMSDPWVTDTARFGCLVGPQFCNSHWDFLQPQIVTPGRTEKTYSRPTSIVLYHVWPTPEQPPCSPRPVCVISIRIWLYDAAPAERTVLRTWGKHIQLTSGEHNKQ